MIENVSYETISRRDLTEERLSSCYWCGSSCNISEVDRIPEEVPQSVRFTLMRRLKSGWELIHCGDCGKYSAVSRHVCFKCGDDLERRRAYHSGHRYCMKCIGVILAGLTRVRVDNTYLAEPPLSPLTPCFICGSDVTRQYSCEHGYAHLECLGGSIEKFLLVDDELSNYTGD